VKSGLRAGRQAAKILVFNSTLLPCQKHITGKVMGFGEITHSIFEKNHCCLRVSGLVTGIANDLDGFKALTTMGPYFRKSLPVKPPSQLTMRMHYKQVSALGSFQKR